jgi:uncharacterized membrane protein YhaH (DUF805 family)
MSFGSAISSCLSKYATFSGRARRTEYWYFYLFNILAHFLVNIAFIIANFVIMPVLMSLGISVETYMILIAAITVIYGLITLASLLPNLAVASRRLHDTGRSAWWIGGGVIGTIAMLVVLVILVALTAGSRRLEIIPSCFLGFFALVSLAYSIMLLVFFCTDGTSGQNKYGPDPKGRGASEKS